MATRSGKVYTPGEGDQDMEMSAGIGAGAGPAPSGASGETGDTVRGLQDRGQSAFARLYDLARGDFRHDFNERLETRDLFTADDLERFQEIAKLITKKGRVWLSTQYINNYQGRTLFDVISEHINRVLPTNPQAPNGKFLHEDELLDSVLGEGQFSAIKEFAKTQRVGPVSDTMSVPVQVTGSLTRTYTVTASPYRLGAKGEPGYAENQNIAHMFQAVTGGNSSKNKFVLIVDASGGLPLSEVLNHTLEPPPTSAGAEFYIVENIENASDSATKIANIKERNKTVGSTQLFFLRDTETTVVYPLWAKDPKDPKSNIFSNLQIVLNRVEGDEIEADISVGDETSKQTFHIGDVATSSNVKNASLRGLALALEKGPNDYETLICALSKRMGDWCQALSMLDLDRQYGMYPSDRSSVIGQTTLRDLLTSAEVGVVTNDRVLLAFCLTLGLNVFYTTAMDTARLVYFKNTADKPAGEELAAEASRRYESAQSEIPKIETEIASQESNRTAITAEYLSKLQTVENIAYYILYLKELLSSLGMVRTKFEELTTQYNAENTKYNATPESSVRFNAATAMMSIVAKLNGDLTHNKSVLEDLRDVRYPGVPGTMVIRLMALDAKLQTGARITQSVEVTEAKDILLGIRDNIKQCLSNGTLTPQQIASVLRSPDSFVAYLGTRGEINIVEILSVIPTLSALLPAQSGGTRQTGGAGEDPVAAVIAMLNTRRIRVLPPDETSNPEFTSTPNIYRLGSSFVDEKLRSYTVANEYITTVEDLDTLNAFFAIVPSLPGGAGSVDPGAGRYICLKYLLLYRDTLENRYFALRAEQKGVEDTGAFEPGTPAFHALHELYDSVYWLNEALNSLTPAAENIWEVITSFRAHLGDAGRDWVALPIPEGTPIDLAGETMAVILSTVEDQLATLRERLLAGFAPPPSPDVVLSEEEPTTAEIEVSAQQKAEASNIVTGWYREQIGAWLWAQHPELSEGQLQSLGDRLEDGIRNKLLDILQGDQYNDNKVGIIVSHTQELGNLAESIVEQWALDNGLTLKSGELAQVNTQGRGIFMARSGIMPTSLAGGGKRSSRRRRLYE